MSIAVSYSAIMGPASGCRWHFQGPCFRSWPGPWRLSRRGTSSRDRRRAPLSGNRRRTCVHTRTDSETMSPGLCESWCRGPRTRVHTRGYASCAAMRPPGPDHREQTVLSCVNRRQNEIGVLLLFATGTRRLAGCVFVRVSVHRVRNSRWRVLDTLPHHTTPQHTTPHAKGCALYFCSAL